MSDTDVTPPAAAVLGQLSVTASLDVTPAAQDGDDGG